jgi:hypothetical protein
MCAGIGYDTLHETPASRTGTSLIKFTDFTNFAVAQDDILRYFA